MAETRTASQLCKRATELQSARQPHEYVWRDCFDLTHPLRGDGFQGNMMDATQGQSRQARILDGTATDSARMLASAIMSGLTPANSRWFGLQVQGETDEERLWLDNAADTLWKNIHNENFDAEAFEACLDIVDAGWFALYIDENRTEGGLSFQQWPLSGVFVASTRADGVVDTVYRKYSLTASAAVTEFGGDMVSEATAKLATTKPDEMVEFLHAIEPRTPHAVGARLAKNLPFASFNAETKSKKIVRESGYHEFPVVVPRWMKIPRSCYGVGPVYDALPDIRMLNDLKAMYLSSADVAISGMWIAEDDGVLNPRTIKLGPRKVIVANSVDSMKPLQTGANFQLADEMVADLKASIRKVLMSDQLQPQDGPAMTATEVHVRVNLIRQLLGPIYGRLQAEYLSRMVERCFGLALRAGALGVPPKSLAGRELSVKYDGPMARAQKMEDVGAIERYMQDAMAVVQGTGDTSVLDNIDMDEANRYTANALGVPTKLMRSDDDVAKVRAQRAQAAQEAQQQAQQAQAQQTITEQTAKAAANQA